MYSVRAIESALLVSGDSAAPPREAHTRSVRCCTMLPEPSDRFFSSGGGLCATGCV